MKKLISVLSILIIALCLIFTGCESDSDDKGKQTLDEKTYFNSNEIMEQITEEIKNAFEENE